MGAYSFIQSKYGIFGNSCEHCGKDFPVPYLTVGSPCYKREVSLCKECNENAVDCSIEHCDNLVTWVINDYYNYVNRVYSCNEHLLEQLKEKNVVVSYKVLRESLKG